MGLLVWPLSCCRCGQRLLAQRHPDPVPGAVAGRAGLNLLTGYTGQTSVGAAGFMAVGAFATYGLLLRLPGWAAAGLLGGGLISRLVAWCSACPVRGSRAST
jgi:ABC-type branched-subunit amino acid transport system permease subunit